jgi:hypothetical protein
LEVKFTGPTVAIRWQTGLLDTAGNEAHAATFIRKRVIFLHKELRGNKTEHQRVFIHEMFHFAWMRLGNRKRLAWEALLRQEWEAGVRGEAGWSAEWRKRKLGEASVLRRTRAWREYCCESFCDTAAWLFGGSEEEVTLSIRPRRRRRRWFDEEFATGCVAI